MSAFSCCLFVASGYIQGLSCPEGEHQYTCFACVSFFSDVLLDYASARQLCQSRQGDLVNVDDSWQAEVIRRYLEGLNESRGAWIGEYYLNNTNCYTASSDAGNWKSAPCAQRRPVVCAKTYGSRKSRREYTTFNITRTTVLHVHICELQFLKYLSYVYSYTTGGSRRRPGARR